MHDDLSPDREEAKSQQIKSHYERHPEWTFVVVDGQDDVVGFLTYRIDRSRRLETIENNAIDPAAQGAGIGSAMYRTCWICPVRRDSPTRA